MSGNIDPKEFGLPPRTILEKIGSDIIAIVMNRKSRIIMADGRKLLEKARKILKVRPDFTVALKTSAPICSKTIKFLEGEEIQVITVD